MLSVEESIQRNGKKAAASQAKLNEPETALEHFTLDSFFDSLNESLAQNYKLQSDIIDIINSPNGANIEELTIAINMWIDEGRDIDVEHAVHFLKFTSEILLGFVSKNLAVCAGCRGKVACRRCASCSTSYCSRECQVAHWPVHRKSGDCRRRKSKKCVL